MPLVLGRQDVSSLMYPSAPEGTLLPEKRRFPLSVRFMMESCMCTLNQSPCCASRRWGASSPLSFVAFMDPERWCFGTSPLGSMRLFNLLPLSPYCAPRSGFACLQTFYPDEKRLFLGHTIKKLDRKLGNRFGSRGVLPELPR